MIDKSMDVITFLQTNISNIVYCTYRGLYIRVIYYVGDVCHVNTFKILKDIIDDDEYSEKLKCIVKDIEFAETVCKNMNNVLMSLGLHKLADKSADIQRQYVGDVFRDGESMSEQRMRLSNTAIWYRYHYESDVVLGVDPVIIETETGNTKGFDFVKVHVHCVSAITHGKEIQRHLIKNELPVIDKIVLDRIRKSSKYKSYGIPINFLRCSSRVLRNDSILEYIFELKNIG